MGIYLPNVTDLRSEAWILIQMSDTKSMILTASQKAVSSSCWSDWQ